MTQEIKMLTVTTCGKCKRNYKVFANADALEKGKMLSKCVYADCGRVGENILVLENK